MTTLRFLRLAGIPTSLAVLVSAGCGATELDAGRVTSQGSADAAGETPFSGGDASVGPVDAPSSGDTSVGTLDAPSAADGIADMPDAGAEICSKGWSGADPLNQPGRYPFTSQLLSGSAQKDVWALVGKGVDHFDGTTWSRHATFANTAFAVAASSPQDVWVGTDQGVVQHWDGSSWRALQTCAWGSVISVSSTGPDDAWAVVTSVGLADGNFIGHYLLLHWDGVAWTPASPPPGPIATVLAVARNDVWLLTNSSNGGEAGGGVPAHWDGSTWSTSSAYEVSALYARSANDVWFAYGGGTWAPPEVLHWDGAQLTTFTDNDGWMGGSWTGQSVWESPSGDVWTGAGPVVGLLHQGAWTFPIASADAIWGSADTDVWLHANDTVTHWNGSALATTNLP